MTAKTADDLKGADYIDSRDIIEAADALRAALTFGESEMDDDEAALLAFDGEDIEDYPYGATFIREDCFEDYARELAVDVGAISGDEQWPLTCIDWPKAARELSIDYSSVRFLGYDYYVR